MPMSRPLAGALFAALIAGLALPAAAAPADDDPVATRQVRFDDLTLSRPADQETLRHRVREAAWKVCVDAVAGAGFGDPIFDACVQAATVGGLQAADARIAAATAHTLLAAGTTK